MTRVNFQHAFVYIHVTELILPLTELKHTGTLFIFLSFIGLYPALPDIKEIDFSTLREEVKESCNFNDKKLLKAK